MEFSDERMHKYSQISKRKIDSHKKRVVPTLTVKNKPSISYVLVRNEPNY